MRLRGPGLCCATVAREWFRISDLTLPQVLDIFNNLESDIESPCAMPRGSSDSILEIQNEDWHRNHEGRGGKKNNQSMPQRVRG